MFGSDGSPILQYVVIFAVIFTALAAIVFVVRRLTGRSLALPGRAGGRGRQPRLGIVDVYELDRARQLILLRRDNVEHLLLVGGPNDVVIERNIQRGQRALPEAGLRPESMAGPLAEPLPDPLAAAGRLPEPPLALPEIAGSEIAGSAIGGRRSGPLFDPGFAMPVVVPAPVPGSGAAPPVTLPLDAALLGGDEPGQDIAVPARPPGSIARASAPPPPVARPSGQVAGPVRESFSARLLRRTAPPVLDPRPEPASERRPAAVPAQDTTPAQDAAPARPEPVPQAAAQVAPLAAPAERRTVDPAILSDMARQLQAALARPSSAVTPAPSPAPPPEPATPEPATPETAPPVPASTVDAVAAAMASTASEPAPDAAPPRSEPPAGPVASRGPAPQQTAPEKPAPSPLAPIPPPPRRETAAIPVPETVRPPVPSLTPVAPPPAAPPPEPAAKTAGNPFSVEEIEAEFARLLGRPLDKRG